MGKSTAAQFLQRRQVPVTDTDQIAREVVKPGQPAFAEIRQAFGETVVEADGQLSRKKLANIVFSDPWARQKIESITHPRIRDSWRRKCALGEATESS